MKSLLVLLLLGSLSAHALTTGTYNIRNFDYDERARISTNKPVLATIIKSLNFDLLGVNEIHETQRFEQFINSNLPGFDVQLSRCGGAHGQNLGFIFNSKKLKLLSFNEDYSVTDPGGNPGCNAPSRPLAIAQFEELATKERFIAIQVHLKSGDNASALNTRFKQYVILKDVVKNLVAAGNKNIVISGDFNTTGFLARTVDYQKFNEMLQGAGLVNLSTKVGCTAYWWGGTDDGIESASQLDHIVATSSFIKIRTASTQVWGHCKARACKDSTPAELGLSYTGVSDHCPQTVTFR